MRRFALPLVILGCVLLAALLTWIALSKASFGGRAPRAEAGAPTVTEALPPFSRLDVSGTAELVLVQGDVESVSLNVAPRKAGGYVGTFVHEGTLFVESEDSSRWWDMVFGGSNTQSPQIVVKFKGIEAIAAAGTVKLTAATFKAADLRIAGAGGTYIKIDDLTAQQLRLSGAGALRADFAGRVVDQTVTISGAGEYRAAKLVSQNATVTVAGAGKVVVNAQKTLKATISGAGSVEYIGNPQVTERVSGAGRVARRE